MPDTAGIARGDGFRYIGCACRAACRRVANNITRERRIIGPQRNDIDNRTHTGRHVINVARDVCIRYGAWCDRCKR